MFNSPKTEIGALINENPLDVIVIPRATLEGKPTFFEHKDKANQIGYTDT